MGNNNGKNIVSNQNQEDQQQEKQKSQKRLLEKNEFHPETALQQMKEANSIQYDFSLFVGEMRTPLDTTYEFYNAPLGSGSLGQVRKALHVPTQTIRAIQLISLSLINSSEQRDIDCDFHLREAVILKQLDHPNIIRMYQYYQDTRFFYIITELCQGGDLYDQIIQKQSFGEDYAAFVFAQILQGIIFCHYKNIVHRDLKPQNIMFSEREDDSLIQIVDFGFANLVPNYQQKMSRQIGSILYMAPEVINRQGYTEKSDIWSIGMILYTMLSGYAAFLGDEDQIKERIINEQVEFKTEDWNFVSNEAQDLILWMLNKDPAKRPTAKQALESDWMKLNFQEQYVDPKIVDKLVRTATIFKPLCEFQTIVCWNIMLMMVTYDTVKLAYRVFDHIDKTNKSGLEYQDILPFIKRAYDGGKNNKGSQSRAQLRTKRLFEIFGKSIDQQISFYEFMLLSMDKEVLLSDKNVEKFLKFIDYGKTNSFTFEEMNYLFMGRKMSDKVKYEIMKEAEDLVKQQDKYLVWRQYISYRLFKYITTKQGIVILKEDYKSSDQQDDDAHDELDEEDFDQNRSDMSDFREGELGERGRSRKGSFSSEDGISQSQSQTDILNTSNGTNKDPNAKQKGNRDKMKKKQRAQKSEKVPRKRKEIQSKILEKVKAVWENDLDKNRVNLIKKLRNEISTSQEGQKNADAISAQKKMSVELDIKSDILPLLEEILFRQIFDQSKLDAQELQEANQMSNLQQKGDKGQKDDKKVENNQDGDNEGDGQNEGGEGGQGQGDGEGDGDGGEGKQNDGFEIDNHNGQVDDDEHQNILDGDSNKDDLQNPIKKKSNSLKQKTTLDNMDLDQGKKK